MKSSIRRGINSGVAAGIVWGWFCMGVNAVSGVFPFEGTLTHNIVTFSVAGAVFGVVVSALTLTVGRLLPFRGQVARAVFISAAIWIVLRAGGMVLSAMEPERYHLLTPEFFQGLLLAAVLGLFLGVVSRRGIFRAA